MTIKIRDLSFDRLSTNDKLLHKPETVKERRSERLVHGSNWFNKA